MHNFLFAACGRFSTATVFGFGLVLVLFVVGCDDPFARVSTLTSPALEERGSFGWSVATVGDIDGDGTPDGAVGAPGELVDAQPFGGRVYLVSGEDGTVLESISSPTPEMRSFFGASIAGVADVDGDGVGDILVGAHRENPQGVEAAGRAYLFSGADGTVIHTLTSPNVVEEGAFGTAVTGAGDLDQDGTPDLLVGASDEPVRDREKAGRAYLISGANGTVLDALSSPNVEREGFFGSSVTGVGDVDGDGTPDVVVGAPRETAEAFGGAGRAYLFSGGTATLLDSLFSPNAQPVGGFGGSVAGIGDVNGDGVSDLVVGAHEETVEEDRRAGRVYFFNGVDRTLLKTFVSPNASGSSLYGESLAPAGDVDEDGRPDILIGAHGETARGQFGAGHAYLIGGADGSVLKTFVSPNPEEEGAFGGSVAGLRPPGGGKASHVLIGAFWETVQEEREGRAYLFGSEL